MTDTKNIHKSDEEAEQRLKEAFGAKTPFQVPDGYFDGLPARVLETCRESDQDFIRPLYRQPMFKKLAAAAAILIMAMAITIVFTNRATDSEALTDYTLMDIYENNLSSMAELEEAYLLSLIGDEAAEDLYFIDDQDARISDEDIIEYLLAENNIEELIMNEYQ